MKTMRQAVRDYLALRRSLGFKLKEHEPRLWKFVSFLEKKGSTRITIPLALQFATQPQHQPPAQWATRGLRVVRGFARYRSGEDPRTEIHRCIYCPIVPDVHDLLCTRQRKSESC